MNDRHTLELVFVVLGVLASIGIVFLVVYLAYWRPNFFYGDFVTISTQDATGKTWWIKNIAKRVDFTDQQSEASVLQFFPGLSGAKGQIFEGNTTTFELKHPYYGAFLAAICTTGTMSDPTPSFSTTTGSQIGAASDGMHILDIQKGNALVDGGVYHLQITGFDCEMLGGCEVEAGCDAIGHYLNIDATNKVELSQDTSDVAKQLWTLHKVHDKTQYQEYQTKTNFLFTTDDDLASGAN